MLADFTVANRAVIVERARARVAQRTCPKPSDVELKSGVPVFLDQLGAALRLAEAHAPEDHRQIKDTAREHGAELLGLGLTIAQVVHDYGDVCQAITELAVEQGAPIPSHEFGILNLCLDDAIAHAVTEYSRQRELVIADQGTERLGMLAHELRNLLESIKTGRVTAGGSTGLVHSRTLLGLRDLIDRSLAEVRLDAGIDRLEPITVAELVEEVEVGALLQANARGVHLSVETVDRALAVRGDRQILAAALANLLQNAFKFTRAQGNVCLRARASGDRVLLEVEDQCGGLPPGKVGDLFEPFKQRGADRTGVGLGLSICLKAARANGGEMRVRDIPGHGCVFTLDLPIMPAVAAAG